MQKLKRKTGRNVFDFSSSAPAEPGAAGAQPMDLDDPVERRFQQMSRK